MENLYSLGYTIFDGIYGISLTTLFELIYRHYKNYYFDYCIEVSYYYNWDTLYAVITPLSENLLNDDDFQSAVYENHERYIPAWKLGLLRDKRGVKIEILDDLVEDGLLVKYIEKGMPTIYRIVDDKGIITYIKEGIDLLSNI